MNTQNFMAKHSFIKIVIVAAVTLAVTSSHAWEVDFSRRNGGKKEAVQARLPASVLAPVDVAPESFVGTFESSAPAEDVVVLNTEQGFVPDTLRFRKGGKYRVRVVNVNNKNKNVSFILDSFSEHHATYFGEVKAFEVTPKAEGIFSFQSPETGAEGKIVVVAQPGVKSVRLPASP